MFHRHDFEFVFSSFEEYFFIQILINFLPMEKKAKSSNRAECYPDLSSPWKKEK